MLVRLTIESMDSDGKCRDAEVPLGRSMPKYLQYGTHRDGASNDIQHLSDD